jgi:hypothetical protein
MMPFKPNYFQERASRERAKNAKKQEKLRKREETTAQRKAARDNAEDATNTISESGESLKRDPP